MDASSHFPPPALGDTRSLSTSPQKPLYSSHNNGAVDDDDDPFGLNDLASKKPSSARDTASAQNDDDILGMLGKPISEVRRETPSTNDKKPSAVARSAHPQEKAVAELMDMGFDVERSREALLHTEDGMSVQEAVGWLLNQAHEESRNKVRPHAREPVSHDRGRQDQTTRSTREEESADPVPQWMRMQEVASRTDSRSPASSEKDVTQYAAEIGVSFLKSANSLWRTGQKKVQKVVTELNYESDGSQPKWMRDDRQADSDNSLPGRSVREQKARAPITPDVTDEAMMLESGGRPPKKHQRPTPIESRLDVGINPPLRRPSPLMQSNLPERRASRPQVAQSQPIPRAPERVSRQLVEEQSAEAYVSPARRRKAPTKPIAQELDMDIFSNSEPEHHPPPPSLSARATPQARPLAAKSSTPLSVRPKAPARTVPDLSSSALSTSTARRLAGTASFKRGDYAEAHSHYTAALSPLPSTHPIAIVVRCNRALTNIKVGDPKAAILDADAALEIIGSSRGEDETLSLGNAEGDKPMKEFYGKALSRKAEALEAMEKWSDAANIWRDAVQAGVGGSVAIQGRNRCEKASGTGATRAAPKPKPVTAAPPRSAPARKATAVARPSATNNLNGGSSTETEAVKRLREANAAAEAASDEAFALTDVVDARLTAWKGGKADNLRALLASLDSVLWSDAGWKKVGMADLVIASRVKIIYMKAIAKVHPDKVCDFEDFARRFTFPDLCDRYPKPPP